MRSAGPCWPIPVFLTKEPDGLSVGRSYVRIDVTSFRHHPHIDAGLRHYWATCSEQIIHIQFTGRAILKSRRIRVDSPKPPVFIFASPTTCHVGSFHSTTGVRTSVGQQQRVKATSVWLPRLGSLLSVRPQLVTNNFYELW